MKPDATDQLVKLQKCLKHVKAWMTSNLLLLNLDKTKTIILEKSFNKRVSNRIHWIAFPWLPVRL